MQRPRNKKCRVCQQPSTGRLCRTCYERKQNKKHYCNDPRVIYNIQASGFNLATTEWPEEVAEKFLENDMEDVGNGI